MSTNGIKSKGEVVLSVPKLIKPNVNMGFYINEEKTKYMVFSRNNINQFCLKMGNFSIEKEDKI